LEGRRKWLVFQALGTTGPCPVKGLESWDREVKCWDIVRRKRLLGIVGMLTIVRF